MNLLKISDAYHEQGLNDPQRQHRMTYGSKRRVAGVVMLLLLPCLSLTACGIKGKLSPPSQIQKEERSESNRAVGRDPIRLR